MDQQTSSSVVQKSVLWAVGLIVAGGLVLVALGFLFVPNGIKIKGNLTTSKGPIDNGTYDLELRTYNVFDSEEPLHVQKIEDVEVRGGAYEVSYYPGKDATSIDTVVEVCAHLQPEDASELDDPTGEAACDGNEASNSVVCPYYVLARTGTRLAWLTGTDTVDSRSQLRCASDGSTLLSTSPVELAREGGMSALALYDWQPTAVTTTNNTTTVENQTINNYLTSVNNFFTNIIAGGGIPEFLTSTEGSDFTITSDPESNTHTFNLPSAGLQARGLVTTGGQTFAGLKTFSNGLKVGNGALLILGNKGTAGDPSGSNGSMYYNESADKFRCYENGAWRDCIPSVNPNAGALLPWSACEPTVIGATTTAPTKASTTEFDCMRYRRVGISASKEVEIDYMYTAANSAGSSAGNGDYLYSLPSGLTFDQNEQPPYTGAINSDATFASAIRFALRDTSSGIVIGAANGGSGGLTAIIPYSSTQYRFVTQNLNDNAAVGSAHQPLNQNNMTFSGRFRIATP